MFFIGSVTKNLSKVLNLCLRKYVNHMYKHHHYRKDMRFYIYLTSALTLAFSIITCWFSVILLGLSE